MNPIQVVALVALDLRALDLRRERLVASDQRHLAHVRRGRCLPAPVVGETARGTRVGLALALTACRT